MRIPPGAEPESRLILLGASNLARGCLALTDAARAAAGLSVQVHAALGHGRSYGKKSRLLGRELCGIETSPIWQQLDTAPPLSLPTTALVMDVGNDLFYGVEVARILEWVDGSLERLERHATRRVLVGIPLPALRRMRPWVYAMFRRVVVPSCQLSLRDGLQQAEELHDGLLRLAERHRATFVPPADDWYGVDPIHIRRRYWPAATRALLALSDASPTARSRTAKPTLDTSLRRLSFLRAAPAERRVRGQIQRTAQPVRAFADGTTISLW